MGSRFKDTKRANHQTDSSGLQGRKVIARGTDRTKDGPAPGGSLPPSRALEGRHGFQLLKAEMPRVGSSSPWNWTCVALKKAAN